MSWLYSQALVEAFLADASLDGERFAPSNTTHTPRAFCSPDRMMDFSRLSRFGMMFAPLTVDLGEDVLTWFLADFPARTLAQQAKAQESLVSEAGSGWKWRESSVKYDQDSRLWKTRQCLLFEDSEWFSETWPRWGLMRDGECWGLPMSGRPIYARGSGLLPTPTVTGCLNGYQQQGKGAYKWAYTIAGYWGAAKTPNGEKRGDLNPCYVEEIMGWPPGWTALDASATAKSPNAQLKHGGS